LNSSYFSSLDSTPVVHAMVLQAQVHVHPLVLLGDPEVDALLKLLESVPYEPPLQETDVSYDRGVDGEELVRSRPLTEWDADSSIHVDLLDNLVPKTIIARATTTRVPLPSIKNTVFVSSGEEEPLPAPFVLEEALEPGVGLVAVDAVEAVVDEAVILL